MTRQTTMQHAVLATDGSPHSEAASAFTAALAWPADATVTITSVVETPDPSDLSISNWEAQALADWRQVIACAHTTRREEAQGYIRAATATLRARQPGLRIDEVVRVGQPASELLALARTTAADLIIAGARGRTVLESLLLGSVSEALTNEAPCPVLIVRDAVPELKVVAVALRTVADADRLAETCLRLPLPGATRIVAVMAGTPRPQTDPAGVRLADKRMQALLAEWDEADQAETRAAGRRFIARMHDGDPERPVTTRVIHGALRPSAFESRADVAPAILEEATALKADLIVVGAREQRGVAAKLGLGSVSRKIVRRAATSVLVVRGDPPA